MNRDPLRALESYYSGQSRVARARFEQAVEASLQAEMQEVDFAPVVSAFRKTLPVAAAILFGVLTPRVSRSDVENLAAKIEQSQASSVRTELEKP